jgi:hypothetical protein
MENKIDTTSVDHQEIETKVRKEFEERYAVEQATLREANRTAIENAIAELRQNATPPTTDEIQTALSQDYVTLVIKVRGANEAGTTTDYEFQLSELPVAKERKFCRLVLEKIRPKWAELYKTAKAFEDGDYTNLVEQLEFIQNIIDPTSEVLTEAVAMVINPRNEHPIVTPNWILENIPTWRCWNIIKAQFEINRIRDFLSNVFQGSNGMIATQVSTRK